MVVTRSALYLVGVLMASLLAACGESGSREGDIEVSHALVTEGDMVAAGYMVLGVGAQETLLGASSPGAEAVSLHTTEDGSMTSVDSLELPAGGDLRLQPGGDHLMLEGLVQPLEPGQTVELTLEMEQAGEVVVEAEVVAYVDVLDAYSGES